MTENDAKEWFTVRCLNVITSQPIEREDSVTVQIRYNHAVAESTFLRVNNKKAMIRFNEPQMAVTPGQSAVLYDGDRVLGGGIIDEIFE